VEACDEVKVWPAVQRQKDFAKGYVININIFLSLRYKDCYYFFLTIFYGNKAQIFKITVNIPTHTELLSVVRKALTRAYNRHIYLRIAPTTTCKHLAITVVNARLRNSNAFPSKNITNTPWN
jgi:hypothetical protein